MTTSEMKSIGQTRQVTIIGLTCAEPHEHCFCNTMGAGPDADSGYDLLMTDLGDRFLIKAGTEKGVRLLEAGYLKDAGDEDRRQREEIIRKVEESLPAKMDLKRITNNLLVKYDDDCGRNSQMYAALAAPATWSVPRATVLP